MVYQNEHFPGAESQPEPDDGLQPEPSHLRPIDTFYGTHTLPNYGGGATLQDLLTDPPETE